MWVWTSPNVGVDLSQCSGGPQSVPYIPGVFNFILLLLVYLQIIFLLFLLLVFRLLLILLLLLLLFSSEPHIRAICSQQRTFRTNIKFL